MLLRRGQGVSCRSTGRVECFRRLSHKEGSISGGGAGVCTCDIQLYQRMGFREDRQAILEALQQGAYAFELRGVPGRNLFQSGTVSAAFVVDAIKSTRGPQARSDVHHQRPDVTVWIMKPTYQGQRWYIKCYLDGGTAWFVSVHPAER